MGRAGRANALSALSFRQSRYFEAALRRVLI